MIREIFMLILLTFLPFLELRYSIPAGILSGRVELPFGMYLQGYGLNWLLVFVVCVITNIIVGILIYYALNISVKFFLRFNWYAKLYNKIIEKPQKKIHAFVEKYGELGVALFIGVPLPGSGVYSGALGAYAIGLSFKKFIIANIIGVLIAGTAVTIITLTGQGIFALL